MTKVEERIEGKLNHGILMDFLGAENVDQLKSRIIDVIVEQVTRDLSSTYEYIIDPDDISSEIKDNIINSAVEKLQPIIEQQVIKKIMSYFGIENL